MSDNFTQPNPYANINLKVSGNSPVNLKPLGSLDAGTVGGPQALQNLEKSFGISDPSTRSSGGGSRGGSGAFGFQDPLSTKFDPANPLGLNKNQLKEQQAQQRAAFLNSIGESVKAKFQANPELNDPNTSVQRKHEIIDYYLANPWAEYVKTQFASDPELGQEVDMSVRQSLARAKDQLAQGINADNIFNEAWEAGKVGFANAEVMRQMVAKNINEATNDQQARDLQGAVDRLAGHAQAYSRGLSLDMQNDLQNIRNTRSAIEALEATLPAQAQEELMRARSNPSRELGFSYNTYQQAQENIADYQAKRATILQELAQKRQQLSSLEGISTEPDALLNQDSLLNGKPEPTHTFYMQGLDKLKEEIADLESQLSDTDASIKASTATSSRAYNDYLNAVDNFYSTHGVDSPELKDLKEQLSGYQKDYATHEQQYNAPNPFQSDLDLARKQYEEYRDFSVRDAAQRLTNLIEAMNDADVQRQLAMENSPLYREVQLRQQELRQMYGDDYLVGLQGNAHKFAHLMAMMAEQTPYLLVSLGSGAVSGGVGLAIAGALMTMGDAASDTVDTMLAQEQSTMDALPEYKELIDKGYNDKEARVLMGLAAARDKQGLAIATGALLNLVGPEAMITKSGLWGKLFGKKGALGDSPVAKNRLARVPTSAATSALEEAAEEGFTKYIANISAQKAGAIVDSMDDVWSSAATGALMGGPMGALGGIASRNNPDVAPMAMLTVTDKDGNVHQEVVPQTDQRSALASMAERFGVADTDIQAQDLSPSVATAVHNARKHDYVELTATDMSGQAHTQIVDKADVKNAIKLLNTEAGIKPEDIQTRTLSEQEKNTYIANRAIAEEAAAQSTAQQGTGSAGQATARTTGQTTATPQGSNTNAPIIQGSPFYNTAGQQAQQQAQATIAQDLKNAFDSIRAQQTAYTADTLPEQDVMALVPVLTRLEQNDPRGTSAVNDVLTGLLGTTASQVNLTWDGLKQRYTDIIAGRANANTSGNQGTAQTSSAPTAPAAGAVNATPTANAPSNTGNSTATQSTGTGGTTRPNTGTTAAPVQSNQPQTATREGTDSGRGGQQPADTGTQPDTGTGSSAGQTEQRTGTDTGTAADGQPEQTGPDVVNQPSQIKTVAELARSTLVTNFGEDLTKETQQRLTEYYDKIYEDISKDSDKLSDPLSENEKVFIATFAVRQAITLSQIQGIAIDDACADLYDSFAYAPLPTGNPGVTTAHAVGFRRRGARKFLDVKIDSAKVSITTKPDKTRFSTIVHEFTHAFFDKTLQYREEIKRAAQAGNTAAIKYIEDLEQLAKLFKVKDPWNYDRWPLRATEAMATSLEGKLLNNQLPARAGLSAALSNIVDRIAEAFQYFLEYLRDRVITYRGLVNFDENTGTIEYPTSTKNSEAIQKFLGYIVPPLNVFRGRTPTALNNYLNRMLTGYLGSDSTLNSVASLNVPDEVRNNAEFISLADATATAYLARNIEAGMSPKDAFENANRVVDEALDIMTMTPEQQSEYIAQKFAKEKQDKVENSPELTMASTPEDAVMAAVGAKDTAYPDILDMQNNLPSPTNTALENTPLPIDDTAELVGHTVPEYEAVPSREQEDAETARLAQEIADATNDDTNPTVPPVESREWFGNFISTGNVLTDEFGEPMLVYRVGNRISTMASGAELEVQTYVQRGEVYNPSMRIDDSVLSGRISRLYNRLLDAYNNGAMDDLNLSERDSQDMIDAGVGSFEFKSSDETTYVIANVNQASDMYEANNTVFDSVEIADNAVDMSGVLNTKATENDILNDATQRVMETETRYQRSLMKQRENLNKIRAYYNSLAYNAVQQAGWWQRLARTARLTGDDGAHFHDWVSVNLVPTMGEADSDPFYQQVINARQEIHGAWATIHDQIMAPFDSYITTVANDIGKPPIDVAIAIGQARTDLHTLEAQDRQIQELNQARVDALMLFSPDAVEAYNQKYDTKFNKDDVDGARDKALVWAENRITTWHELQSPGRNPKPDDVVKLVGGRRAADIREDLARLSQTYGDAILREGVNRLGIAYRDLVSHLIEKGVFSEQDIAGFGQWLYYTPLTVRADLEHGAANDVVSVFSPKMNYHREGSATPAQDGYTALMNMANRSANAIGTVRLGLAAQHAYQHLAMQYQKRDPNVVMAMQRSGNPESGAGGFIRYYNGMAMAPLTMAKAVNVDPALTVRIVEPAQTDRNGNVTVPERTVPYAIWFNDEAIAGRMWQDGQEVSTTLPSYERVQKALTNQFRFDPKAKSNLFVRGVRKSTSLMGSMYTTLTPMFPVINTQRDIIERAFYMASRNYRVVRPDGSMDEINGAVVSARFAAICLNPVTTLQAMQSAWTGKVTAKGDLGKYLEEFKQSGIMTTASIRAMLDTEGNRAYAFLTENVSELKNLSSAIGKGKNILKGVGNTAHKWSEMLYTIAPFAQFMAMRQMGISAEEAAFHVTELMNLRMNSKLGKNVLSVLFPFTASIMQTTLQLAKFYGLSATTFGHSKSKEQLKKAAFTWAATAGMIYLGSALIPMIATALGGGDEDKGYRLLDSMGLSSFNFIPLPIGEGEYLKQPIGFGPSMFGWQMAIALDRINRGADSISAMTFGMLSSIWRNTTPLGGPEFDIHNASDFGQFLGMTICPTILQPLAESFVFKRDHFGGQIDKVAQWRDETERASDSYDPRTPPLFRVMAETLYETIGWDMAPEQIMHTAAGYLAGPLRGIMATIQDDPLVQDPMHTSTRRELGPLLTAMGATSFYAHEGNAIQRDFYNAKSFYDNAIKRAGLGDAIKGKGNQERHSQHIRDVMIQAGFSLEAATDCANLYETEYALRKYGSQYRKDMRKAMSNNADDDTLRMISDTYFRKRNAYLNNQVPMLNIYNSTQTHMELVQYSRQQAQQIRMGNDHVTVFDVLE